MPYPPEQVRSGGWIVAIYKALAVYDVDDPAFDDYEATVTAAKAAEFLSSIRSLGRVDAKQYEIYRRLARIKPKQSIEVLKELEKLEALEVEWDTRTDPVSVKAVTASDSSKAAVFATAATFFEAHNPSAQARAAIEVLEATVHVPVPQANIVSALTAKGYSSASVTSTIDDLVSTQLLTRTQETESGEPLLYNPHVFKKKAADAYKILSGLSSSDRDHALELLEHVRTKPGVPFPAQTDKKIVTLLAKTGIIDISGVQLKSGVSTREFPTTPDIWGVFVHDGGLGKDLIDDSKLLLNSLRYGELYSPSSRGRIISPSVLVNSLIARGSVGPATAIGEDYPLPLARGIVSITESRLNPGRFFMELRKTDVAESVRDVLEQNVILPSGVVPAPEILKHGGGSFYSPESLRAKRQLPDELIEARDSMVFDLRTYRKRT
jgi:hypothetical protein